ncbi:MAG: endonuclease/exonuclease/phosphatase family protein [Fimbriimonadaceae bacterium]
MLKALCLAVVIGPVGCSQQPGPPPTSIRIATYNMEWFGEDANPQRVSNLQSVIKEIDPQVVAFQEVQSKRAAEQVFGDEWEIGIKDNPKEDQETGVAVKKPFVLESSDTVFQDAALDAAFPGGRDVLRAVVKSPSGESFTFYVVHMKSRGGGGRLKTDNQREMAADLLAAHIRGKHESNVIVLGDFNDCPDDVSVNILETGDKRTRGGRASKPGPLLFNLCEKLYDEDGVTHGLSDKFKGKAIPAMVKGAKKENEQWRGKEYSFPSDVRVEQILFDQILVSKNLLDQASETKIYSGADAMRGSIGRVRKSADGLAEYLEKGSRASDHLPVYVDFDLKAQH